MKHCWKFFVCELIHILLIEILNDHKNPIKKKVRRSFKKAKKNSGVYILNKIIFFPPATKYLVFSPPLPLVFTLRREKKWKKFIKLSVQTFLPLK